MRVEENKIFNLTISTITNFSTYKCSVYKSGVFIGTASIIITNSETNEGNYTLVIDNGNQVFKYNEKGISPANGSVANPITIMPLGFTLYDDKGQKINHNVIKNIEWKVSGKDTLIEVSNSHTTPTTNADGTKSYFGTPELNFRIRENCQAAYDKNEVQLIVTYNDKVVSAHSNLTFVKEGENGTNGTDFVCKIIPNVIETGVAPKYPTVIYNEYTKQYSLNYTPKNADTWLKAQLWHDGELIFEGTQSGDTIENKEAEVQWSILRNDYGNGIKDETNFTINPDTAAITYNPVDFEHPANIVKVSIKYNDVEYYATLPITIAKVVNESYDVQLLDTSGFRHVMYTTDGQSPAYDNQPFELIVSQIVGGIKNDISHFETSEFAVDYNWEVKGNVYYSNWKSESNLTKNTLKSATLLRNQVSYKPVDTYNGLCVTNALVCNITRDGTKLASIHIPIHFYINRYGNAALNGWDGNSISLDEKGGIILSPQVGAGKKNDDNTFTGVFMGSVKEPGSEKEEHGLFGYNAGQRTISLNSEDGSARFGKAGSGQIVIDPTTGDAILKSGNFDREKGTGMQIDLSKPSIEFGSGKFGVNSAGEMFAEGFSTTKYVDDSLKERDEQIEELENSVKIFDVTSNTAMLFIPTTVDKYPLASNSYAIAFKGTYKGQDATNAMTVSRISSDIAGITTTISKNVVTFKVVNTEAIAAELNSYTFKFTLKVGEETYTVEKEITVGLAIQGKDGQDGNDGAQGPQGEPGKDGEQGPKGEDGYTPQKGVDYFDGKDGAKGEDGTGVTSIITQYYLSSSNTSQTGGSWKNTQDTWVSGKYFWTREQITWSDGSVTETTPILADGLNKANQTAATADSNASSAVSTANTANSNANQAKQDAAAATSAANTASQTASNALEKANEATSGLSSLSTIVENNYKDLQGQIDGAIATWFYDYDPNTANTLPTKDWTTDTIKDQHLGDLFYIIDNEEKAGQCFRYAKVDGVYKWIIVEDVEVAKAIADAANAQATADGKATIFTGSTTPKNPQAGDLWMKSANDGILTYVNGSWVEYNKYTDDALAQTAKNTADSANTAAGEAKTAANQAKEDASAASAAASNAQTTANSAATAASNADKKANEAKTAANSASSVATEAKQIASGHDKSISDMQAAMDSTLVGSWIEYTITATKDIPSDSAEWSTAINNKATGEYIWQRIVKQFAGKIELEYSEPVCVTSSLKYVINVATQYCKSNMPDTNIPEEEIQKLDWDYKKPDWSDGYYIWSRVETQWSIGDPTYSEIYCDQDALTLNSKIENRAAELISAFEDEGCVRLFKDKIYVLNSPEIESATEILLLDKNGIGFAKKNAGEALQDDMFTSVWHLNGTFDAQSITVTHLSADDITNGVLRLYDTDNKDDDGKLLIFKGNVIASPDEDTDKQAIVAATSDGLEIKFTNGSLFQVSTTKGFNFINPAKEKVLYSSDDGTVINVTKTKIVQQIDFGENLRGLVMERTNGTKQHKGIGFIKI